MLVITSSDLYRQITLSDFNHFLNASSPNLAAFTSIPKGIEKDCDTDLPIISAITLAKYTVADVIGMIEYVERRVLESEAGMGHKLNKMFGDNTGKYRSYGPSPGTIRIFAQGLVSYYDGRNWCKCKA